MKSNKRKSKINFRKIKLLHGIAVIFIILAGIFYLTPIRGVVAHKLAVQGKYYFNGGAYDLEKAVKWYKAAAFVDDKSWIAHYQLARIYFIKNDLKTALAEIDKALAVDPKNKRAYYVRGLVDGYAKNYKASQDDFQKYVDYYQKEWAGYNDLAWAYYQDKEYQKAVDIALKGLEVAPDNPWLLNGLGVSYDALGEKEKGKAVLDKVATLAKDMKADDWKKAYPGNNPETAQWDLAHFRVDVSANLNLASNEFSSGQGKFTAACGGSFGTMGQCSGCTCNWGYQCDMGDDLYSHLHSSGGFLCSSGCGSDAQCCPPPSCTDSSWSPDPSTVCAGEYFTQTSNCGSTRGAWGTAACPINGACNYNTQMFCPSSFPSGNLCASGTQDGPYDNGTSWGWNCWGINGGSSQLGCWAQKAPPLTSCGSVTPGTYCSQSEINIATLCPAPAVPTWLSGTPTRFSWTCTDPCYGSVVPCSVDKKIVDAVCGTAAMPGSAYCPGYVIPESAKCEPLGFFASTPVIESPTSFSWSCNSTCNGSPSGPCTATVSPKYKGVCGSLNGKNICDDSSPEDLATACAPGSVINLNDPGSSYEDWTWKCKGSCDVDSPQCSAKGQGSCGWIETNP